MSNEKYVYNPSTLKYEIYKTPKSKIILRSVAGLCTILLGALVLFFIASHYIPSPKEQSLEREINQLNYHYNLLDRDLDAVAEDLEYLHNKDSDIHRVIFGIDPLDEGIWNGGIGGSNRYQELDNFRESGDIIENSLTKIDQLKRKIELQKKSVDTLYSLAIEREERLLSIPSIKPVKENELKRSMYSLSGYGMRIHPVHKVKKFHKGIDFTAPRGTAIQATGNGVVQRVEKRKNGYGNNVIVYHGYGYSTLYAHMDAVLVKKGDEVTKGQKIGTIGSTGTSTAPHLHYEVRIKGKAINPIDFCMDGLTPKEYQELVNKATVENQSFD